MDKFDDLVYSLRYEAEAILENLKEMDDLDGDEALAQVMRENMEYRSNGIKRSRKRRKNFDFEAALKAL